MNKAEKLKKLQQDAHETCTCTLKAEATQPVFGSGNPNANIVFIGEAPGKDEDLQGVPFVGRAGKFLNEMLESVGMRREDIYITNTVKYRPPGNRDPLPEEVIACFPWLIDELTVIKPKVIVPLGRHALNRFFPDAKISNVHGTLLVKNITFDIRGDKQPFPVNHFFPLYHPAAALYNGSMRETLLTDFAKLKKAVDTLA